MTKRYLVLSILITGLLIIGVLAYSKDKKQNFGKYIPEHLLLKVSKEKVLHNREIDWIVKKEDNTLKNKGKMVSYLYVSDKEILQKNGEDVSKRTKNAQFFPKENNKVIGRFYAGEPFYRDEVENKWYQTETATTSIEAFEKQIEISWLDKLFKRNIFAASGDPIYSGAGDGVVYINLPDQGSSTQNWDANHDAAAGETASYETTSTYYGAVSYTGSSYARIGRVFYPINTEELPDDAEISEALFKAYVPSSASQSNGDNDNNDYITIVQTYQANNTELVVGDFEDCGSDNGNPSRAKYVPIEGSNQIDVTTIVGAQNQYYTWTLNATGRGWISKTGYTKIGMREGHDALDDEPDEKNQVFTRTSEYENTDYDPYIEITYTSGAVAEERKIQSPIIYE